MLGDLAGLNPKQYFLDNKECLGLGYNCLFG